MLTLTEYARRQNSFEQIASKLLSAWMMRCARYMPDKMNRWTGKSEDDLWLLPAVTIDDAYPGRRKGLSTLEPNVREFVKKVEHLAIEANPKHLKWYGSYSSREHRIRLYFDYLDYERFNEQLQKGWISHPWTSWQFYDLLRTRFEALVHELVHAYDDWVSKGNYVNNRRSSAAQAARSNARWIGGDEQLAHSLYLNDPIEINARYYQTVTALSRLAHSPWKEYLWKFKSRFPGWKQLPDKDKRRLIIRLAQEWMYNRYPKARDITEEVKQLRRRLEERYGILVQINVHDNFISIDHIGTNDKNIQSEIIRTVMRFADIRRRQLAVRDIPYTPYAKQLGFVRQKGAKRDYRLPLGTTMYRPSRQKRIGAV